MSAEIANVSDGILTFRITGQLKRPEFAEAQRQAGEIIRGEGKIRFLVLLERFLGTDNSGDWGDISFQMEFDDFIEKIAIVGEKKWEDMTLLFTGKGIRRIPIEYFEPVDLAKAKTWLAE